MCYLHNENHHYANENCLFIGAGCIFVGSIICSVITHINDKKAWMAYLVANGFNDTVKSLGKIADVLLVEEAFGGTSSGMTLRAENFKFAVENCTTHTALARALIKFEGNILFERLSVDFLNSRQNWKSRLIALNGPQSFISLKTEAGFLQSSIIPRSYVHIMTRDLLTLVLGYNLPEFIVWEIFLYLIDASGIRSRLSPLLSYNTDGQGFRNDYYYGGTQCFSNSLLKNSSYQLDTIKIKSLDIVAVTKVKQTPEMVQITDEPPRFNRQGRPMYLGEYDGKNNFYCGIDYNCGPTYGPQCSSCYGFHNY
jgi:hypothetical protein